MRKKKKITIELVYCDQCKDECTSNHIHVEVSTGEHKGKKFDFCNDNHKHVFIRKLFGKKFAPIIHHVKG